MPPACQFALRAPLRPQRELPRKGAARIRGGIVPGRGGGWFGCTAPARRAWRQLDDIAGDRFDLGVVRAAQRHVLGHARHVHGPQPAPKQRPREPAGKPRHQAQEGKRRKAGNAVLTEAGGAHDAHALPQRLRQELLIGDEVRQRPPALSHQRIERIGEIDHDLGVYGVLHPVDDLGRAAACENRADQLELGAERVVEGADQQRPLVLEADDHRRVAAGVVDDYAVDHLAEELRQDALVVDAVRERHDDRPIAELLAHLFGDGFETVVLHRQHDDVDVADLAGPCDRRYAHGAARLCRRGKLIGRYSVDAQGVLRFAAAHDPDRLVAFRYPGRHRRADCAGADEQNLGFAQGRALPSKPRASASSLGEPAPKLHFKCCAGHHIDCGNPRPPGGPSAGLGSSLLLPRADIKPRRRATPSRRLTGSRVPSKLSAVVPARDQKGTRCVRVKVTPTMPRLPPQL